MSASTDPLVILREVFGHARFRGGQEQAIGAVLGHRDAVVLLPTGAGKSSCYQVPAVALSRGGQGTTIVISPLIALMVDQVAGLVGRGIAAAALHSHQEDDEQREVIRRLLAGELAVLYVSPERAVTPSFKPLVERAPIAMLAIDEAHCVSQWGHDFRPEYLRLRELRDVLCAQASRRRTPPTIALTATATPQVMDEIVESLGLAAPAIVRGDFRRPNLAFEVQHHTSDDDKLDATIAALERAGLRGAGNVGRGIVYCSTRKKTESVAERLRDAGFAVGYYHAGRTALARDRAQRGFSSSKTRVLVATSAFGMGIDHPDVRVIVHFQAPGSLEAYYQEAGRAGRDGLPGRCVLLFARGDLVTQRRLAEHGGGGGAVAQRRSEALASIERYAQATACRQRLLCAHFTGTSEHPACGQCDVCLDPDAVEAQRLEANERRASRGARVSAVEALPAPAQQVILDAVASLRRPLGATNLVKMLRGSRCKAMQAHGLLHLPLHGALADASEAQIAATIEHLIAERRLVRQGRKYPTVALPQRRVVERRENRPAPAPARPGPGASAKAARRRGLVKTSRMTIALETYRQKMARELAWKAYMVFQRQVIVALDRQRPTTMEALAAIPGLGPAKLARFGEDLLELVRRHTP